MDMIAQLLERFAPFTTSKEQIYAFHTHLQNQQKSNNTIASYLQDILTCYKHFGSKQPIAHLPYDLLTWRKFFQERYRVIKPSTQRKFLMSLKTFGQYDTQLAAVIGKIQPPKSPANYPKPIMHEHIQQILSQPKSSWQDHRDYTLWMLLYGCGLRISEALSLEINQFRGGLKIHQTTSVDTGNAEVTVNTSVVDKILTVVGKCNKQRQIPLIKPVQDAIANYLSHRPPSNSIALFLNNKQQALSRFQAAYMITVLKNKLGLPEHTSCHKLRHSFVSHLVEQGACLKALQQLVGHASLSTIQSYASVGVAHLQKAHKKAFIDF